MKINQVCELYYEDSYDNNQNFEKAVIFIHGNLTSSYFWRPLIQEIQIQNNKIRCINCDLRGFGRSQSQQEVNCIKDLSDDVDRLISKLFYKWSNEQIAQNLFLAGWSFGGAVIMQLAIDYPGKYQKLILISSCAVAGQAIFNQDEQGFYIQCQSKQEVASNPTIKGYLSSLERKDKQQTKQILQKHLNNEFIKSLDLDKCVEEMLLQSNYIDVCWALNCFNIGGSKLDQAQYIVGPILIYHGKNDQVIPYNYAIGNSIEIGETKCTIILRDKIGHLVPLEDKVELAKAIIDFIYK